MSTKEWLNPKKGYYSILWTQVLELEEGRSSRSKMGKHLLLGYILLGLKTERKGGSNWQRLLRLALRRIWTKLIMKFVWVGGFIYRLNAWEKRKGFWWISKYELEKDIHCQNEYFINKKDNNKIDTKKIKDLAKIDFNNIREL